MNLDFDRPFCVEIYHGYLDFHSTRFLSYHFTLSLVSLALCCVMNPDPSNPSSCTLNLSSDSMDIPAMVAGAGSRSSSVSSSGHRVGKSRKENQPHPLPIQDDQGRPLVPVHPPSRSSRDIEMGPSIPIDSQSVQGGPHLSKAQVLHLQADRTQSSTTHVLHQHDNRTQAIHLGVSHQEFGSVWKCCS